ncbi:hypothetical protein AAY473_026966 [Plecturocebus cupreus]
MTGNTSHPDQFPNIDSWLEIAQTLPPWVRFCAGKKAQCKVLMAQATKGPKRPIHQGDPEEELPLPYVLPAPSAPSPPALPGTHSASVEPVEPDAVGL